MSIQNLEIALAYQFKNRALLEQALTHRSFSSKHNERLEFLGDSVLNCSVAILLYERFARVDEGDLSRLRANLVKQSALADIALNLQLSHYLRLGEGELKSGGFRRPSILADTLEAIFGAIFIDAGFEAANTVIHRFYREILETVDVRSLGKDPKTMLQEYLQGRRMALPDYKVIATHGAAHSQEFEVECSIAQFDLHVTAPGPSRRAAEQAAAKIALEKMMSLSNTPTKSGGKQKKHMQLSLPVAVSQPIKDSES